ncbi:sensor histidine kinase [Actinokineospora enzanensis]|uniref:sensor histidine kinase n=1 Tax=Actinokineospora enzanensis TaxID=155975 RepID=UPI000360E8BC|nr:HAMP domain-containing sensor histidine kinase [Actinokineospora enzanensis]
MRRPSRLTIRARLTLVHGGLFLAAGVVVIALTYALVAQALPVADRVISTRMKEGGLFGEPAQVYGQLAQVADSTRDDALTAMLTQGAVALVLVGAVAVALGWLLAGRMLQPLHRVTDTARRIAQVADRGLHERIALAGPRDEIKELADTFDAMLAHLDSAFDGQRRFIANASHELRTPLTLNRALLEVAVHREPAAPGVRELGLTLLEINARHERLVEGLLLLARADRAPLERSYVDIADIVEHVADRTPAAAVTLRVVAREAPTSGSAVLLERVVQNLVDNGIRHNVPTDGWVSVTTGTEAGRAVLTVANTGPVVPPYEIPALFEPFRRLAADRLATGGAGLGLSIVLAVTRAHGGDVRAVPRPGGGLVVTVALPATASPPSTRPGSLAACPSSSR